MNDMTLKKKSIQILLTAEEYTQVNFLCEKNNLRRGTLLQMYLSSEMHNFMKKPQFGMFIGFSDKDISEKEKAVVIRVGEEIYSILNDYERRTALTKPNIVRFFTIPRIREEFNKETD